MSLQACPLDKLERLLLAVDCSEASGGAVNAAMSLASTCGTAVTAVSVIEYNPEYEASAPDQAEKMEKEAAEYCKSVADLARQQGVTCETVVRRADQAHEGIVKEAADTGADLVIMGRRGLTGLKRLFMGSVTERVVGSSPVNVLVVPRTAELAFKNVLIATDGSQISEFVTRSAVTLAKSTGGNLSAIAVEDKDTTMIDDILGRAKDTAEKEGMQVETIPAKGAAHEVIVNTARERGVDLIVIGSYGMGGLKKRFMGGVTEKVIGTAHCPVMVVRSQ
jgi:nucleotide-binding universal stress UspA family protein